MNKKVVSYVLVFSLIVLLSVSFVSAGWFSDLFGKITGKVVAGDYSSSSTCANAGNEWCSAGSDSKCYSSANSQECDVLGGGFDFKFWKLSC